LSSKLTENDAASATSKEEEEAIYLGELFLNGYAMTKQKRDCKI
jgi:hypothetical protein